MKSPRQYTPAPSRWTAAACAGNSKNRYFRATASGGTLSKKTTSLVSTVSGGVATQLLVRDERPVPPYSFEVLAEFTDDPQTDSEVSKSFDVHHCDRGPRFGGLPPRPHSTRKQPQSCARFPWGKYTVAVGCKVIDHLSKTGGDSLVRTTTFRQRVGTSPLEAANTIHFPHIPLHWLPSSPPRWVYGFISVRYAGGSRTFRNIPR